MLNKNWKIIQKKYNILVDENAKEEHKNFIKNLKKYNMNNIKYRKKYNSFNGK